MMVVSALELSHHGGFQIAGAPLNRGKTRGYFIHSVVGDRLMRMWENINSPVRGEEGYRDPSSEKMSQRFKLHCLESRF